MQAHRADPQSGLTLVELLVAVAIMGIVLTLAVPAFNDLIARERLRGTHAQLLADLKYARSEAVQRNEAVRIDFRSSTTMVCYSIYAVASGGMCNCLLGSEQCLAGPYGASLPLLKLVQLPLSRGVALSTNASSVTVDPTRAAHSRALTITLTSARGSQLVTTVSDRGLVSTCSPDASMSGVPACATP